MRSKGYFDPSRGFYLPAGYYKKVDDGGGPTAGVYTPESVGVEASAVPATGGSYDEPIITNTPESEGITASALPADGGDYVEALITRTPDPEAIGVTITGVSDGGSYDLVVLVEEQQPEGIDVSATGPTGGSYDLA